MDITALGTTVHVDLERSDLDPEVVHHAWHRCLGDPDPDARVVHAGSMTMSALTQAITRELISTQLGHLMMFHAGAVSHPGTGDSVVWIAPGGTGKTTLTAHLGRHYGYISDETVAVEPGTWRIRPYPKPLSIRQDGPYDGKAELSPDDLGLLPAPAEPHVSHILLLERDERFHEPEIVPVRLLDAVTAMAEQTSSIHLLPHPLHLLADMAEHAGGVLHCSYSEYLTMEPLVTQLLGHA